MSFMDKKGVDVNEEENKLEEDFSFLPPPQNKIYVDHAILEEQTGEDESSQFYNSNTYSSVQRQSKTVGRRISDMSHSRDYSRDLSNQTLDSNNVLMIEVDSKGDMRPQPLRK